MVPLAFAMLADMGGFSLALLSVLNEQVEIQLLFYAPACQSLPRALWITLLSFHVLLAIEIGPENLSTLPYASMIRIRSL